MTAEGAAVVLLHGWGLHGGLLSPLADALEAAGHRSRCVDLPGHGGRPYAPPFRDLEALAAAVAADLPPACTLVGWSLGGLVALQQALASDPRVARLVLVCSTPRFVNGDGWHDGLPAAVVEDFAAELELDYRGVIRRFLSLQAGGDPQAGTLLRALRARVFARGEPDPAALRAGLDVLRHSDLRAAVGRIRLPTLVIAGEHDRLTPPAAGAWLAARIPGARLQCIAGAGHAPFLSHPREVERALLDFFADSRDAAA